MDYRPRPKQKEVLAYSGGRMGVSAVPGSGKTYTLSHLAANLISSAALQDGQEVLIVTLVNSAVDNFSSRIGNFVEGKGLLPDIGYRVRTLHGLAHDIVRERPDLVGISDRFSIIDERESIEILKASVSGWLRAHPEFIQNWLDPEIDLTKNYGLRQRFEEAVVSLSNAFISQCKDLQVTPQNLIDQLSKSKINDELLNLGLEIYISYQRALSFRSAVDFNDLIRLALLAVESDSDYLERLRYRWPYILEDEAQDSSRLQEKILRLLVGSQGNWVRVGDPNQAIYETFTTASPEYLRSFLKEPGVEAKNLPDSGRSSASIIALANELIRWTLTDHPVEALRSALSLPYIRPTPPDDPQQNPVDDPDDIHLITTKYKGDSEIDSVVKSLKKWLPSHQEQTVAILVPRNERGIKVVQALKDADIEPVELLQTSLSTRQTAGLLASVLFCLENPESNPRLVNLFKDLNGLASSTNSASDANQGVVTALKSLRRPEEYLWPRADADWLLTLTQQNEDPAVIQKLEDFRSTLRHWQTAILLPPDQLILSIAQDLFSTPADLALCHKLALVLEHSSRIHPEWNLAEFAAELESVSKNQSRLSGFSEEDSGFDPDRYKGQVVVATVHKAKGLEWDRVYLLSVNNYDYPSAQSYDQYISEKWFIRGKLNLEAEALEKLKAVMRGDLPGAFLAEGEATESARYSYAAERLRLFFVGITRAKHSLVITWNTGRENQPSGENTPSLPFTHLQAFWKERRNGESV